MHPGALGSSPPLSFRQGPSALSKLVFFGLFSVMLMVADARFGVVRPVRSAVATALYPLQWLVLRPVIGLHQGGRYFESLNASQLKEASAQYRLGLQSQRAQQVEQLTLENTRLRALLALRQRINMPALAAQVLYDAGDPFSRKVIIDKGALAAVQAGSAVLDELGVLGQVTRVYPLVSEVTLITDRNQAIAVLNARTGVRALAFGDAGHALELRFMDNHVDMKAGDLLVTSGVDAVYPPGMQVARVSTIEHQADSAFARIRCDAIARVNASLHVLVLQPPGDQVPPRPESLPIPAVNQSGKKP
ncbi:cell shape-determining protein MreC [mine drainage metagenome]|uniref:Cell shape-determining protein MreC n=1 Tax=mine drainage metagenome TaxID=410659 RepID=A0A1J5P4Z1_9ZZZZ